MGNKIHRSKVSGLEWGLVCGALSIIDGAQVLLDFFAIGIAVNRFIDIFVGGSLLFYLFIRGEMRNPETAKRLVFAFFATFIIEEIPVLDIAPCWVVDGWYCWRQSVANNKLADQQQKQEQELNKQKMLQGQQEKMIKLQEIREEQQMRKEVSEQNQVQDDDDEYQQVA